MGLSQCFPLKQLPAAGKALSGTIRLKVKLRDQNNELTHGNKLHRVEGNCNVG